MGLNDSTGTTTKNNVYYDLLTLYYAFTMLFTCTISFYYIVSSIVYYVI